MREPIDWSECKKKRGEVHSRMIRLENTFSGRAADNRPHDPEKEKILIRLDMERRRRYIESGKLKMIGERVWEWRIGNDHLTPTLPHEDGEHQE